MLMMLLKMLNFRKILLIVSNKIKIDYFLRRLRMLAERSDYFRSELRSTHHQTWFLPNDQAFASLGSSFQYLFEQSFINNTNEVNDVRYLFWLIEYILSKFLFH